MVTVQTNPFLEIQANRDAVSTVNPTLVGMRMNGLYTDPNSLVPAYFFAKPSDFGGWSSFLTPYSAQDLEDNDVAVLDMLYACYSQGPFQDVGDESGIDYLLKHLRHGLGRRSDFNGMQPNGMMYVVESDDTIHIRDKHGIYSQEQQVDGARTEHECRTAAARGRRRMDNGAKKFKKWDPDHAGEYDTTSAQLKLGASEAAREQLELTTG